MYKQLLTLTTLSLLSALPLEARRLMCEDCEPQCEPECPEHLFVERSQFFVSAEFLYWATETGLLDYAIHKNKTTTSPDTFGIGKYKTAGYGFDPGVRVSAAWYRCPRYWELKGEYTYFRNCDSDSVSNNSGGANYVNPTTAVILTEGPFRRSQGKSELTFHQADLNVARVFDPNPHLRMRVLGGLTLASFDNELSQVHENFLDERIDIDDEWTFFGGGIRMGVTADWYWGCEFYLTAKTSFAALIGTYENTGKQTETGILVRHAEYDDHRFAMHSQFLLGPSWQRPCDCWSIEIFAGYEFNIWMNLQERYRQNVAYTPLVDEAKETYVSSSLFGMHGLSLRLTIGF